jgi:hypothetical protein
MSAGQRTRMTDDETCIDLPGRWYSQAPHARPARRVA